MMISRLQDVGASVKEFGYLSGKYTMELIVGDAVIENPFSWYFVSINHHEDVSSESSQAESEKC